jgi:hypothetical protein
MAHMPGTRQITERWTQAGGQEVASVQDGKIFVTTILGSPEGWPRISYGYLNSLPTDPASLMRLIRHNLQTLPNPFGQGAGAPQVFDAVAALIENNPELPPRLPTARDLHQPGQLRLRGPTRDRHPRAHHGWHGARPRRGSAR